MKNLFKYAASYWKAMIAIMLILFVQAYCDLSLPAYTSNIVNVGIEDEIPEQIAREEMDKLLLFVSEEDGQKVMDAYEEDTESYEKDAYVLKESVSGDEEQMKELQDILKLPMMMTTGFESGSDMTKEVESQLKSSLPDGTVSEDTTIFDIMKMLPGEQRTAMVEKMGEQMDDLPDTILDQAAVSYCKSVYQDLGMDMEKIQTGYLVKTGGMMIALAFLGMAASVLVGFLASRVGASAGRDLRGRVFHKVVGFSNHEFNQFSTASLITRSTNDIQQIQMLIVMLLRMVLYAPILAIGGVFQVMKTNVSMSWIIGLAVIIIACMVLLLFVVAMPKFKMLQKLVDKLNLVTREILTGLSVIRAFSTEKHEEKRFDDANVELTKTNLFVNRAMTFMMPAMMLVMNGVSVLIVWTGAHGISDGQMQVGDMMAFIQYTMQIIMGFLMLCMISIMLPRAAVAADRVEEVLKSETIICDPERPEVLPEQGEGVLSFDHVSFKYPGADEDVLQDITFTARPGQTTAIIGSTGSGKSTTLAAMIDFISSMRNCHILTIEDPIEYVYQQKQALIHQREVYEDVDSFDTALKSAMREDPDVILVGEMRDYETIQAVITLAETGHLVFSTLHTIGAPKTIDRIIDVFPPHKQAQIRAQLASVLQAVVTQQLLPLASGKGRAAALEIMIANDAIKNLIRENKGHQIDTMIQTGRNEGMTTLNASLATLVNTGKVNRMVAERYSLDVGELRQLIR